MWKDGTIHNHKECTERYCLHHYSEQLTRTFAVLVTIDSDGFASDSKINLQF